MSLNNEAPDSWKHFDSLRGEKDETPVVLPGTFIPRSRHRRRRLHSTLTGNMGDSNPVVSGRLELPGSNPRRGLELTAKVTESNHEHRQGVITHRKASIVGTWSSVA